MFTLVSVLAIATALAAATYSKPTINIITILRFSQHLDRNIARNQHSMQSFHYCSYPSTYWLCTCPLTFHMTRSSPFISVAGIFAREKPFSLLWKRGKRLEGVVDARVGGDTMENRYLGRIKSLSKVGQWRKHVCIAGAFWLGSHTTLASVMRLVSNSEGIRSRSGGLFSNLDESGAVFLSSCPSLNIFDSILILIGKTFLLLESVSTHTQPHTPLSNCPEDENSAEGNLSYENVGGGGREPERSVEFTGEAEIGSNVVKEVDQANFGNEGEDRVYEQVVGEDCQPYQAYAVTLKDTYSGSLVRKVHRYAVVAWYIRMSEDTTMLSVLVNILRRGFAGDVRDQLEKICLIAHSTEAATPGARERRGNFSREMISAIKTARAVTHQGIRELEEHEAIRCIETVHTQRISHCQVIRHFCLLKTGRCVRALHSALSSEFRFRINDSLIQLAHDLSAVSTDFFELPSCNCIEHSQSMVNSTTEFRSRLYRICSLPDLKMV
ncbi:hypothetical protein KCU81_g580, partial [Aureobasidium melanogenum]